MVGRHPAVVVGEDGGEQRGEAGEAQQPGHHCTGRLEFRNFIAQYLEKDANADLPSENVKIIAVLSKGSEVSMYLMIFRMKQAVLLME